MLASQWIKQFVITHADVEDITSYLLERETPLTTRDIALYVIQKRLEQDRTTFQDRFKSARIYNPAENYKVGENVMFAKLDLAVGKVISTRSGNNGTHGAFDVISVDLPNDGKREFATNLKTEHPLTKNPSGDLGDTSENLNAVGILDSASVELTGRLLEALRAHKELKQVAGYWFPKDLVLDIDIGTLHLAEAVLDMMGGGPMNPEQILEQIGGLGNSSLNLQSFSLNLAMSNDRRFDEVGPAGKILWFLKRMEPDVVQKVPNILNYRPIEYDDDLLDDDMVDLETELDDEYTDIDFVGKVTKVTTKVIYPHRRLGSIPLNAKTRQIFPTGRTPRISVILIDDTDGERYNAWVVHEFRFVYGLFEYYTKHRLPVGVLLTIRRGENEGEFIISYQAHKARTEFIPIFNPSAENIGFESRRRSIGAEYDPLSILGVDDLQAIETLAKQFSNKSMVTIIRNIINELSKMSPQGTVHFATLYSAVNVLRRCPPGPLFAILQANAEFEDFGNYYWRIAHTER